MSEVKVNSIKGVGANVAAISINNADGTCTANITNKPNRNLIINGSFQVAQRGTSSTDSSYKTVDRWFLAFSGTEENPTQAQGSLTSSDTPFSYGFRKSYKITNGNQTGGADTNNLFYIRHQIESQNIAQSGWNYTDSNSFITLSFWVKASVAQDYHFHVRSIDGTGQVYPMEMTLAANTWTKITKTIPGNSNIQIDNDNGDGFHVTFQMYVGTQYTDSSVNNNQWQAYNGNYFGGKDQTSTWYTTNDATFEVTGIQLEVSDHATDFEHKSFAQELALCQRYFYRIGDGSNAYQIQGNGFIGENGSTKCAKIVINPPVPMRAAPTLSVIGTDSFRATAGGTTMTCTATANTGGIWGAASSGDIIWLDLGRSGSGDPTIGYGCVVYADNNSANLSFVAEL